MTSNFLNPFQPRPNSQRAWEAKPQVEIFDNSDPGDLQTDVNVYLDSLATPDTPQTRYTVNEIQYTSAQEANMVISYSALIHYTIWTAV